MAVSLDDAAARLGRVLGSLELADDLEDGTLGFTEGLPAPRMHACTIPDLEPSLQHAGLSSLASWSPRISTRVPKRVYQCWCLDLRWAFILSRLSRDHDIAVL